MRPQKILVIGAGISGLSAARELVDSGLTVTVLEARNRIGGRTCTDRSFVDFPVELGAEFVHGTTRGSGALVNQLGLRTVPWKKTTDSMIRMEDGAWLTVQDARARYPDFNKVRAWDFTPPAFKPEGESFAEYLTRAGFDAEQIQYFRRAYVNACGEDPDVIDAEQGMRDAETYAGDDLKLLDGYDNVVNHLATGLDIRLHKDVNAIEWHDGVRVTVAGGEVFKADAALITIPIGVLKSHRIRFVPDVSAEKKEALSKLTMGPVTKMIYCFDKPITDQDILAIYSARNPPMWWSPSFGRSDTKYHVWSAFFSGQWARDLLCLPPEEALAQGLETLRAETGKPDLTPVTMKLVNWLGDPYAMGGYTVCLPGGYRAREVLGRPTPPLFWAGEATGESGTVHASFDTGKRAAEEILSYSGFPGSSQKNRI